MGFKSFLFNLVNKICRVEVINGDKEPAPGVLLCANHISNLDPVLIVTALKYETKFMAKKELFKIPLVSSVIKMFGAFPIDRGNVDLNAMKKAIALLDEGNTVGMFPQGTRHSGVDPRSTPVKNGVGMLITRAQTDILPVAIITKNNKSRLFGKKYIVIGDLIKYTDLNIAEKSREEFNRLSAVVFDKICELHDQYSYLADNKNEK